MELQRGFLIGCIKDLSDGFRIANPRKPDNYRRLPHNSGDRAFLSVEQPGCYKFAEGFALDLQKSHQGQELLAAVGIIVITDELIKAEGLVGVDWEGETYPVKSVGMIRLCTSLKVQGSFLKSEWLMKLNARVGLVCDGGKFVYRPFPDYLKAGVLTGT